MPPIHLLESDTDHGSPEPVWRKDVASLALVASNGSVNIVLTHIGPECFWLEEVTTMNEWFDGVTLEPGVWVVTITTSTHEHSTDYGPEYDMELDVGDVTAATDDEVRSHGNDEWPWDPDLFMENWAEVRDWAVEETEEEA